MQRYLIETPHEIHECVELFRQLHAMGYLYNFEWGCQAGVHSGWAIIEAEDDKQAHLAVPLLVRHKARVVRLNRFDPAQEATLHGA
jgi:hypothetical protein